MGLISAILMIVGTLIGTGIFASPGPLFDSVHCTQTSFIIWAFAGIVCAIGAFAYAELGTMFPASGGDFQYLRRAYGKKVAWVFGWSFITILNPIGTAGIAGVLGRMLWTGVNGTAAVWAAGAGAGPLEAGAGTSPNPAFDTGYAPFPKAPLPLNHGPPPQQHHADTMPWVVRGFSIGAIILMGLINILFKEGGKYASNLLAVFKIGGMCMLIVIGSMQAVKNHAQSEALQIPIRESSQNVLDYVSALCFAFFAYNGFNNINLGLGELRDPERNLKRAVFIAMPFVTVLFLLANFAFFSILSSYDLRHVHSLSLHAGHTVLGHPGGFLMAGTVVASALGSINANLWAGSRLLVIMAKDNTIIPFPVARVWSRTGTQAIAILILVGQASFHSLINLDFKTFSKIFSAVGWTWYGLSVAGLLYLRKKRPNYPRPVKVFWPLAAFFVVIAAVLVVGSLTLAFMSSAIQKTGDDEDDGGASSEADGSDGGKYVPIIMFGVVILFMLGVIPAFYLTKRYNHGLNKTAFSSSIPSTVDKSDSEDFGETEDHLDDKRFRSAGVRAGEMVQINPTGPFHQTAIIIDLDHTHHPHYLHPNNNSIDPTSLTTGGVFGAFGPETLADGRPARRHSAASSVTLVGESSKKRSNKHRRPKSKEGSKPAHHHRNREHGRQDGEPSRSQSPDPVVLAHRSENRNGQDEYDEEEEVARVQALRGSKGGREVVGSDGVIRHMSLDHVELGIRTPSGTSSSSRATSSNSSTRSSNNNSDCDEEDESDIDSTRPTTHNRLTKLLFSPFDPTNSSSLSSPSTPYTGGFCMSPTMLTPFGSGSQTASNSPLMASSSPTFATAGGRTFLTSGFYTRSGSHSSETTLGLEGDYHQHEQEQGAADGDVKGKGVRTRQSSACERVEEVAEEEEEGKVLEENRTNNNTTTTTHHGSYLTDFNNNDNNGRQGEDDDGRVHPLTHLPNASTNNNNDSTPPAPWSLP
ncbi:hypothetical protein KI688_005321 [Linnemannia hyalina]|uniref:Amino acid transporter n=1 Tax=Linnemannia hyalina TaxID=64524 RepID=A0A9P7XJW5_9FUNG|nr:hypothetical protein KI688_005321 [Linnemannia hyalina]